MLLARVLPIFAVQISPSVAAPALEAQLIRACSAGLERARCVSATTLGALEPHGFAIVDWAGAEHVSIQVELAGADDAPTVTRELEFAGADPEIERWRAVGFTIALLADDPRFWMPRAPEQQRPAAAVADVPREPPPAEPGDGAGLRGAGVVAELRALAGSGVLSGAWRRGAEARVSVPLDAVFFATASVDYALASAPELELRWFDATLGVGVNAASPFASVDTRLRLELLVENVAVTIQRAGLADRASAWVPGVMVGGDLLWSFDEHWLLSARADAFWLDGSTAIVSAGERLGASAGLGVLLGLGAGHRF